LSHIKPLVPGLLLLGLLTGKPALAAEPVTTQASASRPDPGTVIRKLREALREGEPAFTAEQAKTWTTELIPLVEKAAGRRFKRAPTVRVADRAEVAESLKHDLEPQLRGLMPNLNDAQVRAQANTMAQAMAPVLMGKFGIQDEVLYMMPRNVRPLLKLTGTDERLIQPLVQIFLAHELTHALQDQHMDLSAMIGAIQSIEKSQAFNATIEGHAVWVQDRVGGMLGLDEAVVEVSRLLTAGAIKIDDPMMEMMNRMVGKQFEQIYMGGRRFIAYHHAQGGNERVWQILARPPASTSMIARPETYSHTRLAEIDYAAILKGLETKFGDRTWQVQNIELGHMLIASAYAGLPDATRQKVLDNIDRAQALIARSRFPAGMANVTIIVLKDAALAPTLVGAVEQLTRQNQKDLSAGSGMKVRNLTFVDLAGIRADLARKQSLRIQPPVGKPIDQVTARIARGKVLLEIMVTHIPVTDAQLIDVAAETFQRHAAAVAGPKPVATEPAEAPESVSP